jgi:hypothetical protein
MRVAALVLGLIGGVFGLGIGLQVAIAGTERLPQFFTLIMALCALSSLIGAVISFSSTDPQLLPRRERLGGLIMLPAGVIWFLVTVFMWRPGGPWAGGTAVWQVGFLSVFTMLGGVFALIHSVTYKPPPPAPVWELRRRQGSQRPS